MNMQIKLSKELNDEMLKDINDIMNVSNHDLSQENANLNGEKLSAIQFLTAGVVAKYYGYQHLLDTQPDVYEKFKKGFIHIHDFDHFIHGASTCTQIDLAKVLKGGFWTNGCFEREPSHIDTALIQTAIIFGANQNSQYGGQAIPHFDVDLAPYVTKTYNKFVNKHLEDLRHELFLNPNQSIEDVFNNHAKKHLRRFTESGLTLEEYFKEIEANPYADVSEEDINQERMNKILEHAQKLAMKDTEAAVMQAMEGFVHNLNTLNGSRGGQSVFASIGFGLDTSWEGRMVVRCLLKATINGVGEGFTPIYPIQIFKVKDGVNKKKGDPNFDLLKLAEYTTTKRMYPNYMNMDAPFNRFEGDIRKAPSTMGCVEGHNTVRIKVEGEYKIVPIKDVWDQDNSKEISYNGNPNSLAKRPTNLEVMDIDGNWTSVKTIIRNNNVKNWMEIKTNDGRFITVTDDHPFVTPRGRVKAKDLTLNDNLIKTKLPISNHNYEFNEEAWIKGLIITDGSYSSNVIRISLGLDETDLADAAMKAIKSVFGLESKKIIQDRGQKGNYIDIISRGGSDVCKLLEREFKAMQKSKRRIPEHILNDKSAIASFIAGMFDGDGYVREYSNRPGVFECSIGSTNHILAMQEFELLEELGIAAKITKNKYTKGNSKQFRIVVKTKLPKEFADLMRCGKKVNVLKRSNYSDTQKEISPKIKSIKWIGEGQRYSYDFETESDTFAVSGLQSHNCRTRVFENVDGESYSTGRGNASFTTINLPMVVKEAQLNHVDYKEAVIEYVDLCVRQLLNRFEIQKAQKIGKFEFRYTSGSFDTKGRSLELDDLIGDMLNIDSLSVGFIGLAEAMYIIRPDLEYISDECQEIALDLIKAMRDRTEYHRDKEHLNISLLATPAEGLAGKSIKAYTKMFGPIKLPGTDEHEFFTNSNHVPVWCEISAREKLRIEAKYHPLTLAGHISYVELSAEDAGDLDKVHNLLIDMMDLGIGYGSFNPPIDMCLTCHSTKPAPNGVCTVCGSRQVSYIRRVTGYVTGTTDLWNTGKQDEERHRVKHSLD